MRGKEESDICNITRLPSYSESRFGVGGPEADIETDQSHRVEADNFHVGLVECCWGLSSCPSGQGLESGVTNVKDFPNYKLRLPLSL